MSGAFDDSELFEDEWVDVYDASGRKASLRHLATVRCNNKTYMILGSLQDDADEKGALMLIREDQTVDGATQFVVANDRSEIESVVGQFVLRVMMDHMDELPPEFSDEPDWMDMTEMGDDTEACGCSHKPGEFCYCDDPMYLQ